MLRQTESGRRTLWVAALGLSVLATIGITAASGKPERSPECAQLARMVAGRGHTMLDGQRFRDTERQAYSVCVQDPAVFRKLIRFG